MNCRINLRDKMTKKEKETARKYIELQSNNIMRRYFKLLCVTLNDEFGFGKNRLSKVIDTISKISAEHEQDEIFWEHIDKRVIEQIGIEFKQEKYES